VPEPLFRIRKRRFFRKNKRIRLKGDFEEGDRGNTQPENNTKRIINEALSKLTEKQRSLVMLKDYEGYSYEEIGKIMELNESQVKVYLHRARLLLRDYIVKIENLV
jgi:RNA polymerase sigma-70 factor (ECF subfamily)